jgi:hypothetical protein
MIRSPLFLLLLSAAPVAAMDYQIVVAAQPESPCVRPLNAAVVTVHALGEDLHHFIVEGKDPRYLVSNGAITFCSDSDRAVFFQAMIDIAATRSLRRERELRDYFYMLGNDELIAGIDRRLAATKDAWLRNRLDEVRAAARDGQRRGKRF